MTNEQNNLVSLLKREVLPALGCTGPTAYALVTACCRPYMTAPPQRLTMELSPELFKTGFGVATPGSPEPGIAIAAANGLFGGDWTLGMEVLNTATPATNVQASDFIAARNLSILCDWSQRGIYARAVVTTANETIVSVLEGAYDHILSIAVNGSAVYRSDALGESEGEKAELDLAMLLSFVNTVDVDRIRFLQDGIDMNYALAIEGIKNPFGHEVGRTLFRKACAGFDESFYADPASHIPASACEWGKILVTAAADARMGGCNMPAMCTMGDGNQGITAINPVIAAAQVWDIDEVHTLRAVALSHLVSIYIKSNIGKTTPFCMCGIGSASGVAAAISYLRGATNTQVEAAIINLLSPMMGILCDGAKPGCAFKMCIATEMAFTAAETSLGKVSLGFYDGMADSTLAKTLEHIKEVVKNSSPALSESLVNVIIKKTEALGTLPVR